MEIVSLSNSVGALPCLFSSWYFLYFLEIYQSLCSTCNLEEMEKTLTILIVS